MAVGFPLSRKATQPERTTQPPAATETPHAASPARDAARLTPMHFSQHALEKCALYGVNPELVRDALAEGETFLDLNRGGSRARVFEFLDRPWVAVLTPDDARVITVYPTDQRTVQARRAGGRWLFLNR